ncbi:hypothetical protein [Streptomyces malaysiensis]|uniref:Uncharacterized protein n=1 Tax=Streptomyces malaysiensis TaxID=92644 RepID=A0A7X5XBF4_STRMQ|nr:hypothetical protein [Streptomyces malaysiensis]NIY69385.1 hypothetical protein [Streptomyces malaysiensis]
MLEVLDQEKGLALADALTEAGERIAAGETVSGPAADRYRAAAAEFSDRYAGTYLGKRELRALVGNPRLQVYEDPKSFLTCNHDAFTALCFPDRDRARDGGRSTPDHSRCQSACANISRTNSQITALRAEVTRIDAAAEAGLDPYPIAVREQQRRTHLTENHPPPRRTAAGRSRPRGTTMSTPSNVGPDPAGEAALAQLVGTALASAQDADSRDAAEVRAITDAMVRLLIGAPLHSDGKLTVVSLAAEAGLRRNKLTHKHTGLKDLFYALVKARCLSRRRSPGPRGTARPSSSRTWPASAPNATTCALSFSSWPGSSRSWRLRTTS